MQKFIDVLKKSSTLIALIALGIAGGCAFLNYVGSFPDGFLPVVAHLLRMILFVSIIAGLFVCILLKKEKLLKVFLPLVFAAWLFYYTMSFLGSAYAAREGFEPISIAVGVFSFFVGITLLGVMVLKIVAKLLKPALKEIADLALIFSIPFFFVLMILLIAESAILEFGWSSYFYDFMNLALPVGIIFAYLPYADGDSELVFAKKAKTVKKEEKPEENAEEPVEETVTEEAPVEAEETASEPAEEEVEETASEPVEETAKDEEIDPAVFDEKE